MMLELSVWLALSIVESIQFSVLIASPRTKLLFVFHGLIIIKMHLLLPFSCNKSAQLLYVDVIVTYLCIYMQPYPHSELKEKHNCSTTSVAEYNICHSSFSLCPIYLQSPYTIIVYTSIISSSSSRQLQNDQYQIISISRYLKFLF